MAPGLNVTKLLTEKFTNFMNELECLLMAGISSGPIFASKGRVYLSVAPFKCSTLGLAPVLTHKQ